MQLCKRTQNDDNFQSAEKPKAHFLGILKILLILFDAKELLVQMI
jgi:hypothetical protein